MRSYKKTVVILEIILIFASSLIPVLNANLLPNESNNKNQIEGSLIFKSVENSDLKKMDKSSENDFSSICFESNHNSRDKIVISSDNEDETSQVNIKSIKGGFGKIKLFVTNDGDELPKIAECKIEVDGGYFDKIHFETIHNLTDLEAGETRKITTDQFIFGIGYIDINITMYLEHGANCSPSRALVIGPFVIMND